jgi:hypothetical protein
MWFLKKVEVQPLSNFDILKLVKGSSNERNLGVFCEGFSFSDTLFDNKHNIQMVVKTKETAFKS